MQKLNLLLSKLKSLVMVQKFSVVFSALKKEPISTSYDALMLIFIWLACLAGLVLSSTSYLWLKLKTRRERVLPPTLSSAVSDEPLNDSSLVSVIILAHNEASLIKATVLHTCAQIKIKSRVELIVVDADSTDDTASIVRGLQTPEVVVRLVHSASGRGTALCTGATTARGEVLCFLHADCTLPFGFDALLRQELAQPHVMATAFNYSVDLVDDVTASPLPVGLATMTLFANVRASWCQLPHSHQGLGITQKYYRAVGGYPSVKMMEDFELMGKLRRKALASSKTITIMDAPVSVSTRRWVKQGVFKNVVLSQLLVVCYNFLGFSPETIYRYYYGKN